MDPWDQPVRVPPQQLVPGVNDFRRDWAYLIICNFQRHGWGLRT